MVLFHSQMWRHMIIRFYIPFKLELLALEVKPFLKFLGLINNGLQVNSSSFFLLEPHSGLPLSGTLFSGRTFLFSAGTFLFSKGTLPFSVGTFVLSKNEKYAITVKPVLSGHSKRRPKIGFQDRLSLNEGKKLLQNAPRDAPREHSAILSTFI